MTTKKAPARDDPDTPPTAAEVAAASLLRRSLDDPRVADDLGDFARAVSLAREPRPIDPKVHAALVAKAVRAPPARGRVLFVAFGVASALAVAAAIPLFFRGDDAAPQASGAAATAPLWAPRSSQPLFSEPFARQGGHVERIDRIARARSSDLRENLFALRGAR